MKSKFSRRLGALLLTLALSLTLVVPAWADAADDVTTVTITGEETAKVDKSVELTATITGKYTSVTWSIDTSSSLKPPDASVSQDTSNHPKATVTASKVGSVTVKVTVSGADGNPVEKTHDVEFIPTLTLNQTSLSMKTNATYQLNPTVQPTGQALTWESSNPAVATVSNSGLVTAVAEGTATITVTAQYGKANEVVSAECSVTVTDTLVSSITFSTYNDGSGSQGYNPMILDTGRGEQARYSISPYDATSQALSWSSDKTSVATVDSNGYVTAVGVGQAKITATANQGTSNEVHASFIVEVSGVVLSTTSLSLTLDGTSYTPTFETYGTAAGRGNATIQRYWQSNDPLVAAVNRTTGTITPRGVGETDVSFTYVVNGQPFFIPSIHVVVSEDTSTILQDNATAGAPYVFSDILRDLNAKSPFGNLVYITNLMVPTKEGVLYYNHVSTDDTGFGVGATEQYYYEEGTLGQRYMSGLTFVPNSDFNGVTTITFTGYTADKKTYSGKIRLTVTGSGNVTFITRSGQPLTFTASNFSAACRSETGREIDCVSFSLPEEAKGLFCYGYSGGQYRYLITEQEQYFRTNAPYLDQVTYLPAEFYIGTFRLPFYGIDTAGVSFTGQLNIIVVPNSPAGERKELTYNALLGTTVDFDKFDFEAVCQQVLGSSTSLSYVRFTPPPSSMGTLYYNYRSSGSYDSLVNANTRYYPSRTPRLDDLTFVPAYGRIEPVSIDFEGYSTTGRSFQGTVTIYYRDEGSDGAITYAATSGQAIPFEPSDFSGLCQEITGRDLNYIMFQYLPDTSEGTLYRNYSSSSSTGTKVTTKDRIYRSSLSNVAFAPRSDFVGTVELEFAGYAAGTGERFNGTVRIEVEEGNSTLYYNVYSGSSVYFNAEDFNTICKQSTDGRLNYVRFQLPKAAEGVLYYRSSSTSTTKNRVGSSSSYYYSTSGSNRIGNVLFTAASNFTGTVSIEYTGFSTSGARYVGTVVIDVSYNRNTTLDYTTTSLPFAIPSAELVSACNYVLDRELSYIIFTSLPRTEEGRLYYDYAGYNTGSEVKISTKYYESKSPYLSRLVFVPKEGFEGIVSIPYTAYDTRNDTVSGVVQIEVTRPTTSVFTDMGGHIWAIPSVEFLNSSGIAMGVGNSQYAPASDVKRGDFVLMLYRMFNLRDAGTKSFSDVPEDSYYARAIAGAKAQKVVSAEDDLFYPEEAITRQDAMLYLRNAMRAAGKTVPAGSASELYSFADYNSISSEARSAVISMIHLGIIRGDNYRRINPTGPISRAETAAILHRVMTL